MRLPLVTLCLGTLAFPGLLVSQAARPAATPVRTQPKIAWDLALPYRDVSSLLESDGVLVTGNTTGRGGTFAYDIATGRSLWSIPGQIRGGPSAAGGFAYTVNATREGLRFRLSKLAIKTGKVVWSAAEEDLGNLDGPPLLVNGQVVLVSRNRRVAAYADATGARSWQHEGVQICDGRLSAADGLVYFSGGLASREEMLTALDATTGATVWSSSLITQSGSRGCGAVTAVANGVVVIGVGRDLLAFDARTGARRWSRMVAPTVDGRPESMNFSALVIQNGVVYAASPTAVLGWNLDTGARVFTFATPVPVELSKVQLVVAGDVLYMAAQGTGTGAVTAAYLYAIDLTGKGLLWRHHVAKADTYDTVGTWSTRFVLPLQNGVAYENRQRLVKLVP